MREENNFFLGKIDAKIDEILNITKRNTKDIDKLEDRVTLLENWQWKIMGILGILIPICTGAAAYLMRLAG